MDQIEMADALAGIAAIIERVADENSGNLELRACVVALKACEHALCEAHERDGE